MFFILVIFFEFGSVKIYINSAPKIYSNRSLFEILKFKCSLSTQCCHTLFSLCVCNLYKETNTLTLLIYDNGWVVVFIYYFYHSQLLFLLNLTPFITVMYSVIYGRWFENVWVYMCFMLFKCW